MTSELKNLQNFKEYYEAAIKREILNEWAKIELAKIERKIAKLTK